MPASPRFRRITALALAVCVVCPRWGSAGEVQLKNGVTLSGSPTEIETLIKGPARPNPLPTTTYPIWMIANPLQKYFVPRRQVENVNRDIDLSKGESFRLKHKPMQGGSRAIGVVGDFLEKPEPFDEFGRRKVRLRARPVNLDVIQGVTEISPTYLKIEALNYDWKTALSTSSIPNDVLDRMLRKANPSTDAAHRLRIALFYIQAQKYEPAQRELEAIASEFPNLAANVQQAQLKLRQAMAYDLLSELKLRRASGQHQFVVETALSFPTEDVDSAVLREVREIASQYDAIRDRMAQLPMSLAELQAQLGDDRRVAELAPRRAEIVESLHPANIERLDSFQKLLGDTQLGADEKLALALSGWVVGSANAVTELDQALKFWQARYLILDYLRTTTDAATERSAILDRLKALEGISAARVAQMLPLLPPARDPAGAEPGKPQRIVPGASTDETSIAYWVLLPPEYHPDQPCPLLVALHSEKRPPEQELLFWGGTQTQLGPAQRHGYIVIVPEYSTKPGQAQYDYSPAAHRIVLGVLRDARRRFHVDSDRVFVAGHDMGGDATFDIAFSHPDLFAGAIPITGTSDRHCEYYWENARNLPLYVVSGELDRNTVAKNAKELMRMMQRGFNVIYTEYVGAGPDSFYAEIHKLFDWMSRMRRNPLPKEVEFKTLRETDCQFGWYSFEGLPKGVVEADWDAPKRGPVRPMAVTASMNEANTFVLKSGAARHTIWLTPQNGFVDFDKRVGVRINGTQRFNDFIKPDLEAMLESYRFQGDRQRLFWGVLEFSSGVAR